MFDVKSWAVGALLLSAAVGARAQITDNPLPAPVVKSGLAVEVRDLVRLPDTRNLRPVDQDVDADGLGARELRARRARRPPLRERLARFPLYRRRRPDVGLRRRRARRSRSRGTRGSRAASSASTSTPTSRATVLWYSVHLERADGNPATPDFIPPGYGAERRDVSQRHHGVESRTIPEREHVHGHAARAAARRARRAVLEPSDGPRRVQSDGAAGLAGLRAALHERQRLGLQQRRRAERQQSERDAAARTP